jgi:hypothetical protein
MIVFFPFIKLPKDPVRLQGGTFRAIDESDTSESKMNIYFFEAEKLLKSQKWDITVLETASERLQGDCRKADSDSLELLPDGRLQYVSKGKGWETRGILERLSQDTA